MSSIKTRKHYVIFDMAFSALWAFFYMIAFIYMTNAWRKSDEMFNFAKSNILGAIIFAFLSIFCWVNSCQSFLNDESTKNFQTFSWDLLGWLTNDLRLDPRLLSPKELTKPVTRISIKLILAVQKTWAVGMESSPSKAVPNKVS